MYYIIVTDTYPHHARLYSPSGWSAEEHWWLVPDIWIQADLQATRMVLAILTQGVETSGEFVIFYSISHSLDGVTWIDIDEIFVGNVDQATIKRNALDATLMTRYMRLYVGDFWLWPSLRWGIEGYPL